MQFFPAFTNIIMLEHKVFLALQSLQALISINEFILQKQ